MSASDSLSRPAGSATAKPASESPRRLEYGRVLSRLETLAVSPWFAYVSIFLIQTKVIWGIWQYRDLTNGDTASYFRLAALWTDHLGFDVALSPLYTAFLGSLRWLISDPYDLIVVHRIIIVLAAAMLVLAVLRRFLPPGLAWLLALWWVLDPINFDTVYEVHLFAVLPTMLAVYVAVRFEGFAMRATVFALFLVGAGLVRNELFVAVAAWVAIWVGYELWTRWRKRELAVRVTRRGALAMLVPVALIAVVLAVFLPRAFNRPSTGGSFSTNKGGIVFCQNFIYGARQRGDYSQQLSRNKPLACESLMLTLFHQPLPSFTQALRANPGAMFDHFEWNAHLIPQSLELMLFDQISGGQRDNPDDVPVTYDSPLAFVGLLAVIAFVSVGMALLWRQRRRWWGEWLRDRVWGYAALACLATAALAVMIAIRPRPSYLFNLEVLIFVLIGTSAMVIGSRWPRLARLRAAIPLVAAVILVAVPSHYNANYTTPQAGEGRPLLQMVDRLKPYAPLLGQAETHFLAPQFAGEACDYVTPLGSCGQAYSLLEGIFRRGKGKSVPRLMKQHEINLFYADDLIITNPATRALLGRLQRKGWQALGPPPASSDWTFIRAPASGTSPAPARTGSTSQHRP